jgi:arsenate reductase
MGKRIGWSFADPSGLAGTKDEILEKTRQVRNDIEAKIKKFVSEAATASYWIK